MGKKTNTLYDFKEIRVMRFYFVFIQRQGIVRKGILDTKHNCCNVS